VQAETPTSVHTRGQPGATPGAAILTTLCRARERIADGIDLMSRFGRRAAVALFIGSMHRPRQPLSASPDA